MKKKVLIISESTSGGVRRHIIDLILGLNKDKFDIYLLYGSNRQDKIFKDSKKNLNKNATLIESKYLKRNLNFKEDFKAYREIKHVIRNVKPDIVHCHSSKAGALGRVAAKFMNVEKIFYTPHAYFFQNPKSSKKKKIIYIIIERILSKYFTKKTFNVSNGERDCAIKNKIDKDKKFRTIYNGISDIKLPNKSLVRKKLNIDVDDFLIGVTARLDEQKDPMTFVRIAKKVIKENENIKFIYIGDGPLYKDVSTYINKNNLEKNIYLMGFREDSEFLVSGLDLYLMTSLYEGLPYSAIEAVRARVPIIATRTIGNEEIIIENINGSFFEVGDVNGGSQTIISTIKNYSYNNEEIYQVFKKNFSIEKMISEIEKEYLL